MSIKETINLIHVPKIAGFAIVDWIGTALGAIIIKKIFNIDVYLAFIILILISIIVHVMFKIDTKTNSLLGINSDQLRARSNN